MKIFNLIFVLVCFSLFNSLANAQELVDGERLGNIQIGKSTVYDVISNYGRDYKLIKHTDYSNTLVYEKLGLAFYSCQADSNQEIFSITMQSPFKVKTSKGIVLGKSTFGDLYKKYGVWNKNSAGYEYEDDGLFFNSEIETFSGFETDNMNFAQAKEVTQSQINSSIIGAENNSINLNSSNISANTKISNQINESNVSVNQNNSAESNQTNLNQSENDSENNAFKSELKSVGKKVVKQIELFEKGRLRQCHADFKAENN